ncbi:hypothetical protein, partial [Xanthomonas hortorum]
EPMEAPFYLATSCFHKRNPILRVIFTRMSAEPLVDVLGLKAVERREKFTPSQHQLAANGPGERAGKGPARPLDFADQATFVGMRRRERDTPLRAHVDEFGPL